MPVDIASIDPGVDGVGDRCVGPVELDQRERERMVEGVLRRGMRDPRPRPDRPARPDLDELGLERLTRLGVVLQRRAEHPVATPVAQDATVAQAR